MAACWQTFYSNISKSGNEKVLSKKASVGAYNLKYMNQPSSSTVFIKLFSKPSGTFAPIDKSTEPSSLYCNCSILLSKLALFNSAPSLSYGRRVSSLYNYEFFSLLSIFTIRLYTISDVDQVYPSKLVVFTN